jgi:hypothetical protein
MENLYVDQRFLDLNTSLGVSGQLHDQPALILWIYPGVPIG